VSGELSISIERADGSIKRWGPDEPNASDIPDDLTFSTSIPGGDKDCTCSLLRRIDLDYSDQALFDTVRVYGPGNRTVWQGRMVQFPRDHGDSFGIKPAAVGLSAHLKDDPSFREIYVDRDLARWGGQSLQRQVDLASSDPVYVDAGGAQVAYDATGPALHQSTQRIDTSTASTPQRRAIVESWYDAAGLALASLYYDQGSGNRATNVLPLGAAGWNVKALLCVNDHAGGDTTSNLAGAASAGYLDATTDDRTAAMVQLYFDGTFTGDGDWYVDWKSLAVYGNHGLTLRGSAPGGFYASDVIADVVSRAAPLLDYTTGANGSIEQTSFVIPNLAFVDPTTAEDAISAVNAYHLYDWGVYDGRFFYRQPDPDRLTWKARLSDGAKLSFEGDTAEQVFNGVVVSYTDPSGAKKLVGPPGTIGATAYDELANTSIDNPVNAHGIPRRPGLLNLSVPTTEAGAVQLGYVWLQERSLATRRGQVTLTGTVTHPTEGDVPVWRVQAGDWISISDHPASAPRKIIETSYSHGTRSISCTLDNTPAKTEAILERIGVYSIGRW
jgi:hypothetical protein